MADTQNHPLFVQAYYYACGRNDAKTPEYVPAVVFADNFVENRKAFGSHSVQSFYDEAIRAQTRAKIDAVLHGK